MKWLVANNVVKEDHIWYLKIVDVEENKENKYKSKHYNLMVYQKYFLCSILEHKEPLTEQ